MTKNIDIAERDGTPDESAKALPPRVVPKSEQENAALWLSENGAALESSNEFVAAHGLPLSKHRQF